MNRALLLLSALPLVACAGSKSSGAVPQSFHYAIPGHLIPAGNEHYQCFFVKADTGGTDAKPRGAMKFSYTPDTNTVHHMVIFTSDNGEADGSTRNCLAFENGWNFRYAGGLATGPLTMPDGVAAPLKPHETYVIQIHYLNASTSDVTDHTSVDVEYTPVDASYQYAAIAILGQTGFSIAADGAPHDIVGTCSIPAGYPTTHVFGLWPHMHQIGTHFRVDMTLAGVTTTPIDETWNFGDQKLWLYLPPTAQMFDVAAGDSITTTCTYTNNTGAIVHWGESSTQEMCFNFLYYYPAPNGDGSSCGT